MVYRLLQESLNNCAKHARADLVEIRSRIDDQGYHLVVRDDGVGFDPEDSGRETNAGFGLSAMAERVEMLGGRMSIETRPGQGVRLGFVLPLTEPGRS